MEWLEQHPDRTSQPEMGDTSTLNLLEILNAKHIVIDIDSLVISVSTIFAVSQQSGSIAITSKLAKPSLSVMYPGTDKPPLILSKDDKDTSALFITIADQEYLASTSRDGIRLWNLANNTSKVVYKFEESGLRYLCVIDDRTVACVADEPSSDGFIHIHILKTDAEMWTLSSTHFIKATDSVSDIAFVKTTNGNSCFLLCSLSNSLTQCVEMVGGRVRWQVDKHAVFSPWSMCTDGSTVFVVNPIVNRLHLLSVDDGSVLKSIDLRTHGIRFAGCVLAQVQGEHLYIGHINEKGDTYCISKFTKPTEV